MYRAEFSILSFKIIYGKTFGNEGAWISWSTNGVNFTLYDLTLGALSYHLTTIMMYIDIIHTIITLIQISYPYATR